MKTTGKNMVWKVQKLDNGRWIDVTDRDGDKKTYEDPALANDWIAGARFLDGATYRAVIPGEEPKDPGPEKPALFTQGVISKTILKLLAEKPMCDADLVEELHRMHEEEQRIPWVSPQAIRGARLRLLKKGRIKASGNRKIMPSGLGSMIWEKT